VALTAIQVRACRSSGGVCRSSSMAAVRRWQPHGNRTLRAALPQFG
jgi:hypothetical protein